MNKKQIVILVIFIVLVSVFRNCDFELPFMKNPHFSDIAIGKTFSHSRDGYCEKVADNYCLAVDLGSVTTLGKVPDECSNEEWTYSVVLIAGAIFLVPTTGGSSLGVLAFLG